MWPVWAKNLRQGIAAAGFVDGFVDAVVADSFARIVEMI